MNHSVNLTSDDIQTILNAIDDAKSWNGCPPAQVTAYTRVQSILEGYKAREA